MKCKNTMFSPHKWKVSGFKLANVRKWGGRGESAQDCYTYYLGIIFVRLPGKNSKFKTTPQNAKIYNSMQVWNTPGKQTTWEWRREKYPSALECVARPAEERVVFSLSQKFFAEFESFAESLFLSELMNYQWGRKSANSSGWLPSSSGLNCHKMSHHDIKYFVCQVKLKQEKAANITYWR